MSLVPQQCHDSRTVLVWVPSCSQPVTLPSEGKSSSFSRVPTSLSSVVGKHPISIKDKGEQQTVFF